MKHTQKKLRPFAILGTVGIASMVALWLLPESTPEAAEMRQTPTAVSAEIAPRPATAAPTAAEATLALLKKHGIDPSTLPDSVDLAEWKRVKAENEASIQATLDHGGTTSYDQPGDELPDPRLTGLDPELLETDEAGLAKQLSNSRISESLLDNAVQIVMGAKTPLTREVGIRAIGGVTSVAGAEALATLIEDLDDEDARVAAIGFLNVHGLESDVTERMVRLLGDDGVSDYLKGQITNNLVLTGLLSSRGEGFMPELKARVPSSQHALLERSLKVFIKG